MTLLLMELGGVSMKIGELIYGLNCLESQVSPDLDFQGISMDSRNVREGDIFIAIDGANVDGHHYIKDALNKGAKAAIINHSYLHKVDKDIKFINLICLLMLLKKQTKY